MAIGVLWWVYLAHAALHGVMAGLAAFVATRVGTLVALRPVRRAGADLHWTERARLVLPVRQLGWLCLLFLPIGFGALADAVSHGQGILGHQAAVASAVVSAFTGALIGRRPALAFLPQRLGGVRERVREIAAGCLVRYPQVLLVGAYLWSPSRYDLTTLVLAPSALLSLWLINRGAAFSLCRRLGLAPPAPQSLTDAVAIHCRKQGIAPAPVYVLPMGMANAFALPGLQVAAVTGQALTALTESELAGVLAHEVGHLSEPKSAIRRREGFFWILLLGGIGQHACMAAGNPGHWGIAVIVVAFLLASRLISGFGRAMEQRADQVALALETVPGSFARGLEAIYKINQLPAVMGSRARSHPDLYDRLIAAGAAPDFPKPPPPARDAIRRPWMAVVATGFVFAVVVIGVGFPRALNGEPSDHAVLGHMVRHGVTGSDASVLAYRLFETHDFAGADALYSMAAALTPASPEAWMNAALARAEGADCARAATALAEASRLRDAQPQTAHERFDHIRAAVDRCAAH